MPRKKEPVYETEQYAFPSRLRELMKDTGTKQKDLAQALGVKPQTVSLYTQGQSFPDVNNLAKIARFFGVSADYLIGLSETPSVNEDIQVVCKVTGLSEKAVNALKDADKDELDFISFLIEKRISSDISAKAYGCAIDEYSIMVLDKQYGVVSKGKDAVRKMTCGSDDVRKAFNEVIRLQERVDTRLWRCHKILESAVESFIEYILEREKNNGKH